MVQDLAIYGAGGLGREVWLMVRQINDYKKQWNVVGFFDDAKRSGSEVDGLTVLGGIDELNSIPTSLSVAVAVANSHIRKKIVLGIKNPLILFPVLIHPKAQTGNVANVLRKGTIVTAGVIMTTGITLGEFVIVNLATTIGHDVNIGSYTSIMPGCRISGNVEIGDEVLLGTGAAVLQNLKVGNRSKVGAGAVVVQDVMAGTTVVGVPAKMVIY